MRGTKTGCTTMMDFALVLDGYSVKQTAAFETSSVTLDQGFPNFLGKYNVPQMQMNFLTLSSNHPIFLIYKSLYYIIYQ